MHDILLPLNYYVLFIIFIYLDMQVSNTISISNIIRVVNSNSMAATSAAGTTHPSGAHAFIPIFSVVHIAQTLAHCVVFCKSFFFFLFFFFWPLYFLFYFDSRLLITPLVFSKYSYANYIIKYNIIKRVYLLFARVLK